MALDIIYIELTGRCNLRCVHCGNTQKEELSTEAVKKLIDDFQGSKIMLTGGEPLMHKGLKEIVEHISKKDFTQKITTNGTLLGKHPYLFEHEIGFKISLDGNREGHDRVRGKGTYDLAVEAMKQISSHDKELTIRSTVMRQNYGTIADMLYELDTSGLNIERVNIWPVRNIGRANKRMMLTPREYQQFLEDLYESTREFKPRFGIVVGPMFGIEKQFADGPIKKDDIYTCNLLNKTVQVACNGDVYPCSFVHHALGSIHEKSINDIFSSKEAEEFRRNFLTRNRGKCGKCAAYESCKGGCLAETYMQAEPRDIYCFRGEE